MLANFLLKVSKIKFEKDDMKKRIAEQFMQNHNVIFKHLLLSRTFTIVVLYVLLVLCLFTATLAQEKVVYAITVENSQGDHFITLDDSNFKGENVIVTVRFLSLDTDTSKKQVEFQQIPGVTIKRDEKNAPDKSEELPLSLITFSILKLNFQK